MTARIIQREGIDQLGEGLLWSARENAVFWVDILGRKVHRFRLGDDSVTDWDMPDVIGWLIERENAPGFIAGLGRAFVALQLDPLTVTSIAAPEPEQEGNRFNDAKADQHGRIWAGSMPFGCDRPSGALYRLDQDGSVVRMEDGYTIPNGPAIAPDGDYMFHTDTALGTIFRYAIHPDGTLAPREVFVQFEEGWGHPDGMTLDAEGGLWVACWGGGRVIRFTPDGRFDRSLALPASQITNCCFAGEGLDRLFVTSAAEGVDEEHAGKLFELDPGVKGLAPHRYRG